MPSDYIPDSDAEFDAWQAQFVTYASSHATPLGLTADQITALTSAQTTWNGLYAEHVQARNWAMGARENKDESRAALEQRLRALTAQIQIAPGATDSMRAALGITIRDTTPTPVPAPTTRPVAQIDSSQRLRHVIAFADEGTPTSRAKPAGVTGCQVWVKLGDPAPSDPKEMSYLATDTRTPYTVDFEAEEAGKRAYYMLRWVNTRGEPGPWGAMVTATVLGLEL
ncbi:MAG: hypothetical protein HY321_06525 [Armatimonadetes bacterium]|nr:hypothetical protein [Armatimonadota bacterium]